MGIIGRIGTIIMPVLVLNKDHYGNLHLIVVDFIIPPRHEFGCCGAICLIKGMKP